MLYGRALSSLSLFGNTPKDQLNGAGDARGPLMRSCRETRRPLYYDRDLSSRKLERVQTQGHEPRPRKRAQQLYGQYSKNWPTNGFFQMEIPLRITLLSSSAKSQSALVPEDQDAKPASFVLICWEGRNRTFIHGFKGRCPTVRRPPKCYNHTQKPTAIQGSN